MSGWPTWDDAWPSTAPQLWGLPIILAAFTGLRRGEVLGLQWCDIDLDAGPGPTLRVVKAIQRVRTGDGTRTLQRVDVKTDRARRTIVIDDKVATALRAAMTTQKERRLGLGPAWRGVESHALDLVCARQDGAPLDPDAFTKATRRLAKAVGIDERMRLNDLRHAVATRLLVRKTHPAVVSHYMGHSSPSFTMRVSARHHRHDGPGGSGHRRRLQRSALTQVRMSDPL